MTKLVRHRREELSSRLIFAGLVLVIAVFLGLFAWRLWLSSQGG